MINHKGHQVHKGFVFKSFVTFVPFVVKGVKIVP
jgi:hypothetical protein